MTNFKGITIEESLENKHIFRTVKITKTKVEEVTEEHKTPWIKQWTLHTIEIKENQSNKIAKELSQSLDTKHDWYADFKNSEFHYIIFRNKIFKVDRSNQEQYKPVVKYGLSLGIPDYQLDFSPDYLPDKVQDLRNSKGFFIVIRGPLGCGKSTIAEKLANIFNAEYFSIDRVLDEYGLTKDKEAGYISQRSFIKANEIITPKAKKKLANGISVIFDGNFYWKSQIDDLIKRLEFPHFVFTLKAPLKVCIKRDSQRGKTHGEDAVRAVYKKATRFDYGIVIDTSKSLEKAIKQIISYLP